MIDLTTETLLPLSDAPRHPLLRQGRRRGRPIHRSTLERWRTHGVAGTRLETIKVGGIRATTVEALQRFFDRLADPSLGHDSPTPSDVRRTHASAEAELVAAGR